MGLFKKMRDPRVIDSMQDHRDDGLARMRAAERMVILLDQNDRLIALQEETNDLLRRLLEQ